ncbi:tyrosine-type recombinase/integrase [Thermanaerosceptrum fracticalcis]|uniref:Tyrosine-type recombinase/integrase n=1 Tax=Thermanaerosceptrum fracticalcis TaxID=1712410 RepID=A0A7G6E7W9_THEFR|nr:site-specific integrase [Thermanaerosceptrum fracticalcis]QNB48173.1 tyrosine-type recombinase/integrase [Thermanaerosceptrum fracticalcis]
MANIRKRPNGTYQAAIYVGRDANGKKIIEYITRDSWHECKAAAREREQELEAWNNGGSLKKIKVVDWIEEWIGLNEKRLSPSTVKLYKMYLRAHYAPFFGNMKLDKLAGNEILLRRFMAEKLKTVSANTTCKLMTVLNKILREALRDKNPLKYIELPKKEKYVPHVPNDAEFAQIHEAVKGTIDELFILLAAWCGLRLGEICALKPNDIFRERGVIRVDESLAVNDQYEWEYKPPKSANGVREIAVPEYLMDLLNDYIIKKGKIPDKIFDYVPGGYTHRWARIVKEKNLPDIRFHDLRHYHASWLYAQGIPDQYAAKRLGHDIQTLKGIYQHLGLDKEKILDDNIRQLLPRGKKQKENAGQNNQEAT